MSGGGGIAGSYRGAVDEAAGQARAFKRALVRLPAVAFFGLSIRFCLSTYANIMALDDGAHIWHATVANFNGVPVKDLV